MANTHTDKLQQMYALLESIEINEGTLIKMGEFMRDIYRAHEDLERKVEEQVIQYEYIPRRVKRSRRQKMLTYAEKCKSEHYTICKLCGISLIQKNGMKVHQDLLCCYKGRWVKDKANKKHLPVLKGIESNDLKKINTINNLLTMIGTDVFKTKMLLNTSIRNIDGIDKRIANAMLWNINYSKMDKIYASGRCPEPQGVSTTNALFNIVRTRKKEAVRESFPPSVDY